MKINFKTKRSAYYFGILLLVLYALPKVDFIVDYLYPILNYELVPGIPIITMVAVITGFAAFFGFKYRRIG